MVRNSLKKVLIVAAYAPPLNCIASRRVENWVKFLPRFGYEPTVLARYFDRESCGTFAEEYSELDELGLKGGYLVDQPYIYTNFVHKPLPKLIRNSKVSAFLHFLVPEPERMAWVAYCRRALASIEEPPSIVIATVGPPTTLKIAKIAAELFKVPWIADFRDYWIYPKDDGSRIKRILQRRHLAGCSGITTVTEGIAGDLAEQLNPLTKETRVIYNGIANDGPPKPSPEDCSVVANFDALKKRYRRIVLYTGTLYERQQIMFFLEGMRDLRNGEDEVAVLLLGNHSAERYSAFDFVHVLGGVRRETSRYFQREADGLLYPTVSSEESCFSGKIFEYVEAGKPIWIGPTPSRDLVEFMGDCPAVRVVRERSELGVLLDEAGPDGPPTGGAPVMPEKMTAEYSVRQLAAFFDAVGAA